ncbi:unnamed protein product, partial [Ixodes pacificus]
RTDTSATRHQHYYFSAYSSVPSVLRIFNISEEDSLTLYLAYMDVGKCSVFRNVYVKEDACCVTVPQSLLGQSTIYCDFAYDLLCGTKKYYISDANCQNED